MNNPSKLLNKWLTLKKKFEEHKKFKEVKDGQRQKLAIRNGFKELGGFTPRDLGTSEGQEKFTQKKTSLGGKLKKYCRVVKASKEGDAKVREDYLKKVKQLTVVVGRLDPKTVDLTAAPESTSEAVGDLDAVDTATLDVELNRPDTEPEAEEVDARPAAERFNELLQQARTHYLRLNQSDPARAREVLALINAAVALGNKGKHEEGVAALKEVVASLAHDLGAGTVAPKAQPPVPVESTANWRKRIDLKKCSFGRPLAKGGQGEVILLDTTDKGAPPLIAKVPLIDPLEPQGGERYLAEMKKEEKFYAKIGDHPNIAKCMGVQKIGGHDALVLEAIDGKDMSKTLDVMRAKLARGQISQEQFWGTMQFTMAKTLQALAHMESKGVVHHDIKPQNIMLDATTGDVKVIDMGGATETGGRHVAFTWGFVAPDLWGGKGVDGKADVFSIGATAFQVGEKRRFDYNKPNPQDSAELKQAVKDYGAGGDSALHQGGASRVDKEGERHKVSGRYDAATAYTDFVNALMNPDPTKRPTATEALKHPFLADMILDEESIKNVIKETVKPKPEVPPAPVTSEDKAAGKKIDKALATVASLQKAGDKLLKDAEAVLTDVRKAQATPAATDKDRAKRQEALGKLRKSHAKYVTAAAKWKGQNTAKAGELRVLREGVADPVVWDAYDLKIEKALEHLRGAEESLQAVLTQVLDHLDGKTPAPVARDAEGVMQETENKLAEAANARHNYAAFAEVFTRNAQAFQQTAKQPRTSSEQRLAYREKRLKYLEILGVLTGKAAGFVERFERLIADLEKLAATWKETPPPGGAHKARAQSCVKKLLEELPALRKTQTELLKAKTQVATDAKAYAVDPFDTEG